MELQHGECLRVEFDSTLEAAHEAVRGIISWMEARQLSEDECRAWELVLAEATTNAVRHGVASGLLRLEAVSSAEAVEVRLTDHGPAFEWPESAGLPEDDEAENGRGLFIIQTICDETHCLRGRGINVLVLVKKRQVPAHKSEDTAATLELMTAELAACYETLAGLFRLSSEAARDVSSEILASTWLEELRRMAGADFLCLRMVGSDSTFLETVASSPPSASFAKALVMADTRCIESRACHTKQDQWFDDGSNFHPNDPLLEAGSEISGVAHPLECGGEAIGVLVMGAHSPHWEPMAREINVVRSLGDFLGTLLHSLRRREEANHSRLMKRELQIAADIQRSLLPAQLPQSVLVQSAGHLTSVGEVGGDFLDAIALADGSYLFVIADVMGKGVPAALFAAAFRSSLHSHLHLASQPAALMRKLNDCLFVELERADMFITAQFAHLSADARYLRTCGAGHGPLLFTDGRQIQEIGSEGPPLGVSKKYEYTHEETLLPLSAHLLMHTDGLSDAACSGTHITRKMLHDWLLYTSIAGMDAASARDSLCKLHSLHRENAPFQDDATFVVLALGASFPLSPSQPTLTHASR